MQFSLLKKLNCIEIYLNMFDYNYFLGEKKNIF